MTECSNKRRFSEPSPSSREYWRKRRSRAAGTGMPPSAGPGKAHRWARHPYLGEDSVFFFGKFEGRYSNLIKEDFPETGLPALPHGWSVPRVCI